MMFVTIKHPPRLWALRAFLDVPVEKGKEETYGVTCFKQKAGDGAGQEEYISISEHKHELAMLDSLHLDGLHAPALAHADDLHRLGDKLTDLENRFKRATEPRGLKKFYLKWFTDYYVKYL